jgi:hypothetical protein
MPGAEEREATPGARPNRCRCGHYPVAHMRVVAVGPASAGSSRLEPSGPCEVCGAAACAKFVPSSRVR